MNTDISGIFHRLSVHFACGCVRSGWLPDRVEIKVRPGMTRQCLNCGRQEVRMVVLGSEDDSGSQEFRMVVVD